MLSAAQRGLCSAEGWFKLVCCSVCVLQTAVAPQAACGAGLLANTCSDVTQAVLLCCRQLQMLYIKACCLAHKTFSHTESVQVKHLERKTGEDVPYSEVAKYLQDKLHSSLAASGRLGSSLLTSTGSLPRMGSRFDMRASAAGNAQANEGNSDDEEDSRTRRRRR